MSYASLAALAMHFYSWRCTECMNNPKRRTNQHFAAAFMFCVKRFSAFFYLKLQEIGEKKQKEKV
jgi:hypothetical protein